MEEELSISKKIELSKYYYNDSQDALKSSNLLFKYGYYKDAIRSAYYACFNIIGSLLILNNMFVENYNTMSMEFYYGFIKTNLIDQEIHTKFCELHSIKNTVNYTKPFTISKDKTEQYLKYTNDIFNTVKNLRKEIINKISKTHKINKNNLNL
jgi:uncharacterized protein (UPF0332 family)